MRPLIIANFERVEDTTFVVSQLFGEDGYLFDTVMYPCDDSAAVIELIRKLAERHRIDTFELWTREPSLYAASLGEIGVAASIKHPSDVASTQCVIEENRDVLIELYGLRLQEESAPVRELTGWRRALVNVLKKLIKRIEGAVGYGI
ncbi:hypothetical protein [Paenibacillus sp. 23TSA30-6]|uniref:hypothetical protein n=1 Tax=Paenibacillus sp. 23TSA30-6 TaxID=2546104 RepID=UPI001787C513|nr:hypothetical protein [Paenibacillus sp. 23TSA30-6]MBE0335577.1 hypothetical protein [Paenibacillus sp. 23TSA30-6]